MPGLGIGFAPPSKHRGLERDNFEAMSAHRPYPTRPKRFQADEIREGEPYELSGGYKIHCEPTGGRGSQATQVGAAVLASDPAVESAGIDTGFTPAPDTLRAPDIAVGNVPSEPGWVKGVPPLAVEYADTGQDEADLTVKLGELLAAGTLRLAATKTSADVLLDKRGPHRGEEKA